MAVEALRPRRDAWSGDSENAAEIRSRFWAPCAAAFRHGSLSRSIRLECQVNATFGGICRLGMLKCEHAALSLPHQSQEWSDLRLYLPSASTLYRYTKLRKRRRPLFSICACLSRIRQMITASAVAYPAPTPAEQKHVRNRKRNSWDWLLCSTSRMPQ